MAEYALQVLNELIPRDKLIIHRLKVVPGGNPGLFMFNPAISNLLPHDPTDLRLLDPCPF